MKSKLLCKRLCYGWFKVFGLNVYFCFFLRFNEDGNEIIENGKINIFRFIDINLKVFW